MKRALYHRARFTAHDITADDVRDARAALTRIAAMEAGLLSPSKDAPR